MVGTDANGQENRKTIGGMPQRQWALLFGLAMP
jgi:hypothetical protein